MKIKVKNRAGDKKSDLRAIRLEGNIPAVLYSKGETGEKIEVNGGDFGALLRSIKQGFLPATTLTIVGEDNKERNVLVKDIQYHPTTYRILHLDLEELHADVPVNVKVPIECIGAVDCVGVKLGGVLRQVIRHLRLRCLPKDIPTSLQLNVQHLELKQSARLEEIEIPDNVRPLVSLRTVAATVGKR